MLRACGFVFMHLGPTETGDGIGARNWPMRGGKHSVWEGGVRAVAFMNAPKWMVAKRGWTYNGLMHGADWLATLGAAIGFSFNGTRLPDGSVKPQLALDGVSQWDTLSNSSGLDPISGSSGSSISGAGGSFSANGGDDNGQGPAGPRAGLVIGNSTNACSWEGRLDAEGRPEYAELLEKYQPGGLVNSDASFNSDAGSSNSETAKCGFAIREGNWKLIQGFGGGPTGWCNASFVNATAANPKGKKVEHCDNHLDPAAHLPSGAAAVGDDAAATCVGGYCLYDVSIDQNERHEVSAANPTVVMALAAKLDAVLQSYSEYQIDKTCGPATFANDPVVGKTWQPWCY